MYRVVAGAFDRTSSFVCCALVVALLAVVSLGALTRSVGEPLIWTDELSRFLMVWLAVFGWVLASRKRIQVRIRYFQNLLPPRAHTAVEALIQVALALLGVLIAWYSVGLVIRNHDLEATTLPLSMAWMYAPMVLAGAVTAAQGVIELADAARRARATSPVGETEVE